jgi:uncharacterized protein YcbX
VPSHLGRVAALTRYPVKSLVGEPLTAAQIEQRGVVGDRTWAVYTEDGGIGSGKTTRRFRRVDGLLGLSATTDGDAPVVRTPDGRSAVAGTPDADALVSATLDRPLRLAAETAVPHHDSARTSSWTSRAPAFRRTSGTAGCWRSGTTSSCVRTAAWPAAAWSTSWTAADPRATAW